MTRSPLIHSAAGPHFLDVEALHVALHVPHQIPFQVAFGFPNPIPAHSNSVSMLFLGLLDSASTLCAFLCLSFVRTYLFIHPYRPPANFDVLRLGMYYS